MNQCSNCGSYFEESYKYCPKCGAELSKSNSKSSKQNYVLIAFIILCCIIGLNVFSTKTSNDVNISTNINATNANDEKVLEQIIKVESKMRDVQSKVETEYYKYQDWLSRGYVYSSSPSWSKILDLKDEMGKLFDEEIRLVRQLSDNTEILQEVQQRKRDVIRAMDKMTLPPGL